MAETQPSKIRTIGRSRTLAIDVGGTHLKATVVDDGGHFLMEPVRVNTPVGSSPRAFVKTLAKLVAPLGVYDRVSVGFPGAIRNGHVLTAPNLGNKGWAGFELEAALTKVLGKPVRVANDADMQGLAVISGKGLEMIITLGTGFGTGIYVDGRLAPHIELGRHPFRKGKSYDEYVGNAARRRVGSRKWNRRVKRAIAQIRDLVNFDHLYVGGGNAKKIDFNSGADVTIVPNTAGMAGGAGLWKD
jgi:polyphosphate glucokinase